MAHLKHCKYCGGKHRKESMAKKCKRKHTKEYWKV